MTFAAITIQLKDNQSGRVFIPVAKLDTVQIPAQLPILQAELERCFTEPDDVSRLQLIGETLNLINIEVDIFPSEDSPVSWHCYIRSPAHQREIFFACTLATTQVLNQLLDKINFVLETATFQYIGDLATQATIQAGLEAWMTRVWPGKNRPILKIRLF